MCLFNTPSMDPPKAPVEYAQQKQPDGAAVRSSTSRRTMDRMRAASGTILTSGSGVTAAAPSMGKTLLGQ